MTAQTMSFQEVAAGFAQRAQALHVSIEAAREAAAVITHDALSLAADVGAYARDPAADTSFPSEKRDELIGALNALEAGVTELTKVKI